MPTTHVVLVSWREGAAEEAERTIRPAVAAFGSTIPDLLGVVEGHSTSVEGLEGGFHYGFVLTFASAPARDVYLDHPEHLPVARAIQAAAERVVVFDI
ncbi:MAG: Dabb family protein [Lapillicoccus sp.]